MTRRDRSDARKRTLEARSREHSSRGEARIVTCPDCRGHIRVKPGGDDPDICGGCGSRLLCANCRTALVQFTEEQLAGGDCPRCNEPFTGEDAGPGSDDFTWADS